MKIIEVENLSKKYILNSSPRKFTLREFLLGSFDFLRRTKEPPKELWALRDLSFHVREGETVGLIGNNGAGKSTLLKILSRIVRPTEGQAVLRGRTGSLLEIGTGFHRELSGYENIYLNGAILGMKRAEIERRFDEIVEFSGLEEFLGTPIKHYSSGMYMRLAFAVAAHLEPEILMVDEVLAVGDLAFQRKCLDKMRDVNKHGRTIIFVSHNLKAVTRLCKRAIWIDAGRIRYDGDANETVSQYLNSQLKMSSERVWKNPEEAPGNETARLRSVRICDENGAPASTFDIRKPLDVEITYDVIKSGQVLMPSFRLFNEEGVCVFVSNDLDREWRRRERPKGTYKSRARIPGNLLAEGTFFAAVSCRTYEPLIEHFSERDVAAFHVTDSLEGDSARGDFAGRMEGVVRPLFEWSTEVIKGGFH